MSHLTNIISCFPPLETRIASACTMKAISQLRGFPVKSSSAIVCYILRPNVFSSQNFTSAPRRQSRLTALTCVVWGVSWTSLTRNLKSHFLCLLFGILLDSLCLFGRSSVISSDIIHLNYIYKYAYAYIIIYICSLYSLGKEIQYNYCHPNVLFIPSAFF